MPIYRRVPKFGFTNPNRVSYRGLNLDSIQKLAQELNIDMINPEILIANGLLGKNDRVKILGRGELTVKLEINAHAFTETAHNAIQAVGGVANII